MTTPLELYRSRLWRAWSSTGEPQITEIPPNKAQLHARISADPFDGGVTARWLADLEHTVTVSWRAVRDARTGHTIHCVSDRGDTKALTADLRLGLRLLAWMSQKEPVTWYWWDQPWPRQLPGNTEPGREHINGGWAVPGVPEVHVYRREEAHKVLLHETIHALGLDVPHSSVAPVRKQLEASMGRHLWPHLGEAYTELFAEWLWAIARAKGVGEALTFWTQQVECATGQAAAVWARIHDSHEDEDTNVFAYYVLKMVLMGHLEEALLRPGHAVRYWYRWWIEAKPALDRLAHDAKLTESVTLPMGMTCLTHET